MVILCDNKITSTKSVSDLKSFARKLHLNVKSIQFEDLISFYRLNNFQKSIAIKKGATVVTPESFSERAVISPERTSIGTEGVSTTKQKKKPQRLPFVSEKGKLKKEKRDNFFEKIWNERPHKSQVSGKPLRYTFNKRMYFVFSHVVTKGAYPGLEFNPQNIVLMTREEHRVWENYRYKVENDPDWRWVFELHDRLIREYWTS